MVWVMLFACAPESPCDTVCPSCAAPLPEGTTLSLSFSLSLPFSLYLHLSAWFRKSATVPRPSNAHDKLAAWHLERAHSAMISSRTPRKPRTRTHTHTQKHVACFVGISAGAQFCAACGAALLDQPDQPRASGSRPLPCPSFYHLFLLALSLEGLSGPSPIRAHALPCRWSCRAQKRCAPLAAEALYECHGWRNRGSDPGRCPRSSLVTGGCTHVVVLAIRKIFDT